MNPKFLSGMLLGILMMYVYSCSEQQSENKESREQVAMTDSDIVTPAPGDTANPKATSASYPCACSNEKRFNVSAPISAENYPIHAIEACKSMVQRAGNSDVQGFWFSKVTLDLMFCHKEDANGIYVYEGVDDKNQKIYVAEAGRNDRIETLDDGVSYVYYSRGMCPTICGQCSY